MAIDLRCEGRSLPQLRAAALSLRGGGVGYYPRSDFVHVDCGPIRHLVIFQVRARLSPASTRIPEPPVVAPRL
jgi:hypothetical protein